MTYVLKLCDVRSQGSARHNNKPHAEPWPLVAEGYRLPLRTVLLAPLQNQDAGEVPHAGAYRCLSQHSTTVANKGGKTCKQGECMAGACAA